jgi:NADH-quinone oxidoreductase subunit J
MSTILLVLLVILLISAVWAVIEPELLKAAIALGVTSIVLAMLMFLLNSPLAAVFELSVCAGLITVVFISAISLTRMLSPEAELTRVRERWRRFTPLPILLLVLAIVLYYKLPLPSLPGLPANTAPLDTREIIWNWRRFDLVGQVLIILAGVIGVVVLFKEVFGKKEGNK